MYEFQHGCAHGGRYDDSTSFEKDAVVVGDLITVVSKGLRSNWNIFWPSILDSVYEIGECRVCLCALFEFFQFGFGDGKGMEDVNVVLLAL